MRHLIFMVALAGCYAPSYGNGDLACAPDGTCPDGLACNPGDQRCYVAGEAPVDAAPDAVVEDVPPVAITFPVDGSTTAADVAVTFTSTAAADFTFECTMDEDTAPCTSGKAYTLASGSHTFAVRAVGPLGTKGAASEVTWTVDTRAATITIDGNPPDMAYTTAKAASFTFAAEPPDLVELACKVDGNAFEPCVSPQALSSLAEGPHTFTVQATRLGVVTTAARTWTVDSIAPASPTFSGTPTGGLVNTKSASFTFSATDANTITYQCSRDGASYAACTSPQTFTVAGDGAHSFAVLAHDPAGNTTVLGVVGWTVDATPPTTTLSQDILSATNQTAVTFTYASSESGGFACTLDGVARTCTGTSHALSGLALGTHTFEIAARDPAGNLDPTPASHTFAVTTNPLLRYAFDGNPNNSGAIANTPVDFNGTGSNVTYTSGKFGVGVRFASSSSSYVMLPTKTLTDTGHPFTVSVWWFEQSVVNSSTLINFGAQYALESYHGAGGGPYLTSCVTSVACGSFPYDVGQWNNLIYRYAGAGSNVDLYLNGVKQVTLTGVPGDLFAGFANATVGTSSNMFVDEIRLYDQVFTDAVQCTRVLGGTYSGTTCTPP